MISTRLHGAIDYLMAIVLIISPYIFDFALYGAEMWVPVLLGFFIIIYSITTAYECGVTPVISMRTHLWLDGSGGLFLALSPWIFGFASFVFLPHLIFGIAEVLAAVTTEKIPKTTPQTAAS